MPTWSVPSRSESEAGIPAAGALAQHPRFLADGAAAASALAARPHGRRRPAAGKLTARPRGRRHPMAVVLAPATVDNMGRKNTEEKVAVLHDVGRKRMRWARWEQASSQAGLGLALGHWAVGWHGPVRGSRRWRSLFAGLALGRIYLTGRVVPPVVLGERPRHSPRTVPARALAIPGRAVLGPGQNIELRVRLRAAWPSVGFRAEKNATVSI